MEYESLRKANLLKDRIIRDGSIIQDSNYYVANKEHMSRSKTYYIVEDYKLLKFLGYVKDKRTVRND